MASARPGSPGPCPYSAGQSQHRAVEGEICVEGGGAAQCLHALRNPVERVAAGGRVGRGALLRIGLLPRLRGILVAILLILLRIGRGFLRRLLILLLVRRGLAAVFLLVRLIRRRGVGRVVPGSRRRRRIVGVDRLLRQHRDGDGEQGGGKYGATSHSSNENAGEGGKLRRNGNIGDGEDWRSGQQTTGSSLRSG